MAYPAKKKFDFFNGGKGREEYQQDYSPSDCAQASPNATCNDALSSYKHSQEISTTSSRERKYPNNPSRTSCNYDKVVYVIDVEDENSTDCVSAQEFSDNDIEIIEYIPPKKAASHYYSNVSYSDHLRHSSEVCPNKAFPYQQPNEWSYPSTNRQIANRVQDGKSSVNPVHNEAMNGQSNLSKKNFTPHHHLNDPNSCYNTNLHNSNHSNIRTNSANQIYSNPVSGRPSNIDQSQSVSNFPAQFDGHKKYPSDGQPLSEEPEVSQHSAPTQFTTSHNSAFVPVQPQRGNSELQTHAASSSSPSFSSPSSKVMRSGKKKIKRKQTCRLCQNHGIIVPMRGHKYVCKYRSCTCSDCESTHERRRVVKEHIRHNRQQSIVATVQLEGGESENSRTSDGANSLKPFPKVDSMLEDIDSIDTNLFEQINLFFQPS